MAKDIRVIYIASIIAIIAFLCMQFFWLFNRYEYSIREYQNKVTEEVLSVYNEYYQYRDGYVKKEWAGKGYRNMVNYSMDYKTDSVGNRHHFLTVAAWRFQPWRILGGEVDDDFSDAEIQKAYQLARQGLYPHVDSIVVEAVIDNSPNGAANWSAAEAVYLEFQNPFEVAAFDSLLVESRVDAQVALSAMPKIEWEHSVKINHSIFNPSVTIIIPYSPLEKKSVEVKCVVPAGYLLCNMWGTLVIVVLISILLIVCLLWQFKIIFRLDRLDKIRNNFVTTMVHELKRPVSTLKMCVSGLHNPAMMADFEIREELLRETKNSLDLLATSFSKMRDLTFNNCDQIPLNCEMILLRQLVDAIIGKMTWPTGKVVTFEIEIDGNVEIFVDRTHISNVLINLIENAIKYSGDVVKITVCASLGNDGSLSIAVRDNGNGISETDIDKIFARFYRGSAANTDIPGIGLGLAYVKLLVEAHGGSISVKSHTTHPDKGTQFIINIPQ